MNAHEDPDSGGLAEDVADLTAHHAALASQVGDLTAKVDGLLSTAGDDDAGGKTSPTGPGTEQGSGKHETPPLILRLEGEAYDRELRQLGRWVQHLLAPVYLSEVNPHEPWCARWWEHLHAVASLHALWTAWQKLTTPDVGGWTGAADWERDYLGPCLRELRSPHGPFASCITNDRTDREQQHTVMPAPPVEPVSDTDTDGDRDTP